jgi:RNA polymerase sigma-70 factor (ECF subfamily)
MIAIFERGSEDPTRAGGSGALAQDVSAAATTAVFLQTRVVEERRRQLEAMFRQHAPRILDYARYRGASLAEAEDVVSEVFVVLTRRLDDAPPEVLPWLYGVARRVLANQVRGNRRRSALQDRSREMAMMANRAEQELSAAAARDLQIHQGLSMLTEKDREAILLIAWDGLRYEEAARALGCTHAAFRQRIARARRNLLALIDDIRTYEETDGHAGWSGIGSREV